MELNKLDNLGLEFLKQNPEQAFNMITKQYEDQMKELRESSHSKEEDVILYEECLGQGDMFTDIDVVYLTADDSDSHTFWQLYIDGNKDATYEQKSGSGFNNNRFSKLCEYNYIINGKKVMFIYPTSTWINWDSLNTFTKDFAEKMNAKCIIQKVYELSRELDLKRN